MCIANRIVRARKNNEKFKVYVVIPLLPAFEANFSSRKYSNIKEIMKIQYECISRGDHSLFKVLEKEGINYDEYIVFLSLRKGHIDENRAVYEQIYVHSKIIIADGNRAIIGSANLNDRSLLGERDSEVGIILEEESEGMILGLLKDLLAEHLGIREEKLISGERKETELDEYFRRAFFQDEWRNVETDVFFNSVKKRAEINTKMFRELFRSIPDDDIKSTKDYIRFISESSLNKLDLPDRNLLYDVLQRIRGHFAIFPLHFLENEIYQSELLSLQGFIPEIIFY
jgi:phospholipase D1/2